MAQVVVAIAGRTYRMNCEDGQESHIEALAADLDRRMAQLRASFGEIGEQRLTMMTALTVIDELTESRRERQELEERLADARRLLEEEGEQRALLEAALTERLDEAAQKISSIAQALSRG